MVRDHHRYLAQNFSFTPKRSPASLSSHRPHPLLAEKGRAGHTGPCGRGWGKEDLGFDPRAARTLEAVGRGGAGPDSGAHGRPLAATGRTGPGGRGWEPGTGASRLQWSRCAVRRLGQVEAQEGKKWAGSWLTMKMEPTGSMVEDRTGRQAGGGGAWGQGSRKKPVALHTPSATPTH